MAHKSLGWQIARISWYGRAFIDRQLANYDINGGYLAFLLAVDRHEGMSQDEISKELHIDKTTTTRAVKPLVNNKYLIRKQDPGDKRKQLLYLTQKGKKIIPILKKITKRWTETLIENLSDKQKDELYDTLEKMIFNAETALNIRKNRAKE